jgi:hypothetical protein
MTGRKNDGEARQQATTTTTAIAMATTATTSARTTATCDTNASRTTGFIFFPSYVPSCTIQ